MTKLPRHTCPNIDKVKRSLQENANDIQNIINNVDTIEVGYVTVNNNIIDLAELLRDINHNLNQVYEYSLEELRDSNSELRNCYDEAIEEKENIEKELCKLQDKLEESEFELEQLRNQCDYNSKKEYQF